jgi:peroxiredoxin
MRLLITALLAFALLMAAGPVSVQAAALGTQLEPTRTRILRHMPPFKPEPTNYNLADELGRRAVVFMYWIPDYPQSVNELVELNRLAQSLKNDKLTIITVSRARDAQELGKIQAIIESKGINLPVLLDDMTLMQQLGVSTVPSYVAVNADRRVQINDVGGLDRKLQNGDVMREVISRAAAQGSFPRAKGPGQNAVYQLLGEKAPGFKLSDLNGKTVDLASHIGKKPLVLVFWSALCPHCQVEMPKLQSYLNRHGDKVNILSVTRFNNDAHKTRTHGFVKSEKLTFPVVVDDAGVNDNYNITAIPTWMLIDLDGRVQHVTVGASSELIQTLDEEIAKALKAKGGKGR